MRRAGLLLLLTIALGVGCAAKKPPPPVIETQEAELGGSDSERPIAKKAPVLEPKTTAAPTPVDDDAAPKPLGGTASVGSTPVVKLLEPGKAPRKVAKHTFRTGSTQKLMMRSKTRVSGNLPVPTLTLDGPINVKITEVNGDGAGRFSLDAGPFKQGQSAPKGGGGLSGMLGGLLGGLGGGAASAMGGGPPEKIAGWGWVNPQGSVTEFHVTEGAGDDQAPVEVGRVPDGAHRRGSSLGGARHDRRQGRPGRANQYLPARLLLRHHAEGEGEACSGPRERQLVG